MADILPPTREPGRRSGRNKRRRAAPTDGPSGKPEPAPVGISVGAVQPAERQRPPLAPPRTHAAKAHGIAPAAAKAQACVGAQSVSSPRIDTPQPQRTGAPYHRQAYAAIDLGTNNCRLLIARPSGDHFVVIDAFSRVVRLGEGLAQSGRLSDAAMDRALAALHICADKLRKRNVHLARSVATEACRRASNGADFIARVHRETGIRLDIITAQEEARLAVLGCHILLEHGDGLAMIFDIGGGSTEMVLVDPTGGVPHILDWQSVPWGVVSLTESIGAIGDSAEARLAAYDDMRSRVARDFAAFAERITPLRDDALATGAMRLMGTSGTVTTLASLYLELPQYDRRAIDGVIVPTGAMRDISQRLSRLSYAERVALPCIGRERSDLVVAGCAILETIFDIWPAPRLGIADRGIREGILRSLMASGNTPERGPAATNGTPNGASIQTGNHR
ncbi:Ppx/GppA phosphatase family protein [Novosphingobium sp.]|uniref:Ppx/GppA phosphatase family protein n=1 Tax=Novosphingobium sp. TaxID=1874826 RepID=UPI0038B984E6